MNLNCLEYLGVMMILFIVSIAIIFIYYTIKDIIGKWKKLNRNRCPFCGAYLRGYRHSHKGAKFSANYCSKCGRSLSSTENDSDYVKEKK